MHGRVKVSTSEEQKAEKEKSRERKLKLFVAVRDKIWAKRQSGELDEELLSLTGQVLLKSPDIYTVWNIRREIILALEGSPGSESGEQNQKRLSDELPLVDGCLLNNPKSYGAWHHRCWIVGRQSQPDFTRELEVCDLALQADERNFHCWDYRRFVCSMAEIPIAKELDFTDAKLRENFSNYSAWHYRSSLMPDIFPDPTNSLALEKSKLESEIDFVQNAFFTDPEDSSAWIYHYWLLSSKCSVEPQLQGMSVNLDDHFATLVFSRPIRLTLAQYEVCLSTDVATAAPHSMRSTDGSRSSKIWLLKSSLLAVADSPVTYRLDVNVKGAKITADCIVEPGEKFSISKSTKFDTDSLPTEVQSVLEAEVVSCTQLVELEPNNKWPRMNLLLVERAIGRKITDDSMVNLVELLKIEDPKRRQFYEDLRSRYLLEDLLKSSHAELQTVTLSGLGLTRLASFTGLMAFVRVLDISNNQLSSVGSLVHLPNLEVLTADDNLIESLATLQNLPVLKEVSVRRNRLKSADQVQMLAASATIAKLNLEGNPVALVPEECSKLKQLCHFPISI